MGLISTVAHGAILLMMATTPQAEQAPAPSDPGTPVMVTPATQTATSLRIPAATIVDIEIAEPLSSKTAKIDAIFSIRLAEPLTDGERVILPAGTPGKGQVVHAAKAGGMGRAGELLLAARYLEFNGSKIPLRRFRLGGSGKDRSHDSLLVGAAVGLLPTFFMKGGEVDFPNGTRAHATVAADTEIPAEPSSTADAAPTNP